jgi:NAD-dependent deacetylase
MLDNDVVSLAVDYISNADLLIIAGTSLTVYPASGLINYFRGENIVLINKDETAMDSRADLVINQSLGEVFSELQF